MPLCDCVYVRLFTCISLSVYLCALTTRHAIIDPHDYKVRKQGGVSVCSRGGLCDCVGAHALAQACEHWFVSL